MKVSTKYLPGTKVYYITSWDGSLQQGVVASFEEATKYVSDNHFYGFADQRIIVARWEGLSAGLGWMPEADVYAVDKTKTEKPKPSVDWTKPIQSSGGSELTVLTTVRPHTHPVVYMNSTSGLLGSCNIDGTICGKVVVTNVPPKPVEEVRYLYLLQRKSNPAMVSVHVSKSPDWAPTNTRSKVLAVKKVTVAEGESL